MSPVLDPVLPFKRRIQELLEIDKRLRSERPKLEPDLSLAEFTKAAWPLYEPTRPLIWGWHLDAICEHLEAVTYGKIHNLIINIPPRLSKSSMVCVFWPIWTWTHQPEKKFLFASYGSDLSERDSLSCRRIIESNWYQARYGKRFQLLKDRYMISKYETNAGGFRQSTSVGGIGTGTGGDIIVCDDPLKADDGNSKTKRDYANRWWSETMASRLNDQKTGAKVLIMQRVHEEDLTGYLLATVPEQYDHVCLPMLYEKECDPEGEPLPKHYTSIGFCDPRNEDGELLSPERFGPDEIERLRASSTEYAWAGQYQQRPSPRGGGTFRLDKIDEVDAIPNGTRLVRVRAWDRAGTQDGGAYTAGVLLSWDVDHGKFYIEHMVRGQWATDQREKVTKDTAREDGTLVRILLEQEPGSAGIDSVLATTRMLISDPTMARGFSVHAIRVTGSKDVRAEPLATSISVGNFAIVRGNWDHQALKHEMENWPNGRYRDQVDALSLGYNWLCNITLGPAKTMSSLPPPKFAVR